MDSFESAVTVLECDIACAKSEDTLFATVKISDLQPVLDALTTLQAREATLIRERDAARFDLGNMKIRCRHLLECVGSDDLTREDKIFIASTREALATSDLAEG